MFCFVLLLGRHVKRCNIYFAINTTFCGICWAKCIELMLQFFYYPNITLATSHISEYSSDQVIQATLFCNLSRNKCCIGSVAHDATSTRNKLACCKKVETLFSLCNKKIVVRGGGNTCNKQLQLATQHLLCDKLQENVARIL